MVALSLFRVREGGAPLFINQRWTLDLKRERTEGRKRKKFLYLFRCYTHTHPAKAGSTLKGKRKKKRTHEGQTAKNSAGGGGEQTHLRNQPTRRNGPNQNSAHT